MEYLIIINKSTGKRETSYPLAPPVESFDQLYEQVQTSEFADTDKYLYLRDVTGGIQAQLINQNAYWLNNKIEIRPSDIHDWDGTKWVINQQKQAQLLSNKRQQCIDSIDNTAAQYLAKWTRFTSEYEVREAAALEYKANNYQGDASIYITGFATAAELDLRTATDLILQQANQLRSTLANMSALRMRKYELKQNNLTLEQMQTIHDDIISKMQQLAEAQQ